MLEVYTANTPNGVKVPIALEELGVPYRLHLVDLAAKEQKRPAFLAMNPNGRIPVLVDVSDDGRSKRIVFESGAILWYLGERFGKLIPADLDGRAAALAWTFFQVGGIGPMFGQAGWFLRSSPERMDAAIQRYTDEANRLTDVLERRLRESPWLAGSEYSVADIMNFAWLDISAYAAVELSQYPAVNAWVERIRSRPAVIRGQAAFDVPAPVS